MKSLAFVTIFFFLFCPQLFPQSSPIKGRLFQWVDQDGQKPVPRARIALRGGQFTRTDDLGNFVLKCEDCRVGESVEFEIEAGRLGSQIRRGIIREDFSTNVYINKDNLSFILGIVKDKRTQKPIQGVEVRFSSDQFVIEGNKPKDVVTDKFGEFSYLLEKDKYGSVKQLRIRCIDPSGRYKFYEDDHDIRSHITIFMADTLSGDLVKAKAAYNEVKTEMFDLFAKLSALINVFSLMPAQPYPYPRTPNQTKAQHQQEAKLFQQNYLDGVSSQLRMSTYSDPVLKAYNKELYKDTVLSTSLKLLYKNLEEGFYAFQSYEGRLIELLREELSDDRRANKALRTYKEKMLKAKISLCMALWNYFAMPDADISLVNFYLEGSRIPLTLTSKKDAPSELMLQAANYQKEIADLLKEDLYATNSSLSTPDGCPYDESYQEAPVKLFQEAAFSFLEGNGSCTKYYFQKATEVDKLPKQLKQYAKASIHRLQNPDLYKNSLGAYVVSLEKGGLFEESGLKVGDVIIQIEDEVMNDISLIPLVLGREYIGPLSFHVIRDEKLQRISVDGARSARVLVSQLIVFTTYRF